MSGCDQNKKEKSAGAATRSLISMLQRACTVAAHVAGMHMQHSTRLHLLLSIAQHAAHALPPCTRFAALSSADGAQHQTLRISSERERGGDKLRACTSGAAPPCAPPSADDSDATGRVDCCRIAPYGASTCCRSAPARARQKQSVGIGTPCPARPRATTAAVSTEGAEDAAHINVATVAQRPDTCQALHSHDDLSSKAVSTSRDTAFFSAHSHWPSALSHCHVCHLTRPKRQALAPPSRPKHSVTHGPCPASNAAVCACKFLPAARWRT